MTISAEQITFTGDTAWLVLPEVWTGPDDMLARYRLLDRPCEWCNGEGSNETVERDIWYCPDCIDGRHTFEIEVECDVCAGKAEWCGFGRIGNPLCSNGTATYRVSIVPGMMLEIVADDSCPRRPVVSMQHGNPYLLDGKMITRVGELPPVAKPGMWAVQLNVQPKGQT